MQSPFYFIVKPVGDTRYVNTKEIDGVPLIVSTSEEDHRYSNRMAEVLELPAHYEGDVQRGDILLVHHNVFKFYNDVHGRSRSGRSFFKDGIFLIDSEQYFMHKHNGVWHARDRFCFMAAVPPHKGVIISLATKEPLVGEMLFPNEKITAMGVGVGDLVCFTPIGDYAFEVDGEILYRLFDHQITMLL